MREQVAADLRRVREKYGSWIYVLHPGVIASMLYRLAHLTHGHPVTRPVSVFLSVLVIGGVKVGDRAVVGAHAVVISDIPAGQVADGVPARPRAARPAHP